MIPSLMLVFALIFFPPVFADGPGSKCCSEIDLTNPDCMVTNVVYLGDDLIRAWRSDGAAFDVHMSKINLVPRKSEEIDNAIPQNGLRFTVKVNNTIKTIEHLVEKRKLGSRSALVVDGKRIESDENGCTADPDVPAVVRLLFGCESKTFDTMILHHVGSFSSKDGADTILVGYYRASGQEDNSNGSLTRVVAWNATDSSLLHEGSFMDQSDTVSVTGLWERNGKELIISLNSHGHMCFHEREYESLDFGIPGVGEKFMPKCLPANMLFGCPQSFCFTGYFDEYVEAKLDNDRRLMTMIRGMYWYSKPGLNVRQSNAELISGAHRKKYFKDRSISAAYNLPIDILTHSHQCDHYILDDGETVIVFDYDEWKYESRSLGELKLDETIRRRDNRNITAAYGGLFLYEYDQFDAIFLKNMVYLKAGQFVRVGSDDRTIAPTIKHEVYNPNGIIDISHCGWTDDLMKELIHKINQTKTETSIVSKMIPAVRGPDSTTTSVNNITTAHEGNVTSTTSQTTSFMLKPVFRKVAVIVTGWIVIFAVSFLIVHLIKWKLRAHPRKPVTPKLDDYSSGIVSGSISAGSVDD
jgi:hypothetical protein